MGISNTLLAATGVFLVVFLLLGPVTAWSPPTPPPPTRRGFLEKASMAVIASQVVQPPSALAFVGTPDKVYQPPPDSLTGKVIVNTGSSTGLGLESAKRLAAAGATTVLTTRSTSKGTKAVAEVQSYLKSINTNNHNVYFLTLDLENLDSVRAFPQQFQDQLGNTTKIDVLMNNAGVAAIPQKEFTPDGFERTFQVNHLGPFLLTSLLFPILNNNNSDGARIINVASVAHKFKFGETQNKNTNAGLDFDNLNSEREYLGDGWQSYGRSKLENILFAQELQRRADQKGLQWLSVSSLHPGVVATDIWRTSVVRKDEKNNPWQSLVSRAFYNSILTVSEGANTQVWLASQLDPAIGRGEYYDENGKVPKLDGFAKDRVAARKLWERSEELLGIQFQL